MRSILLLILLPLELFAQTATTVDSISEVVPNRWRLSLSLHRDNGIINPYAKSFDQIVLRLQRPEAIQLGADFRPFKNSSFLWLTAEVGHYQVKAENKNLRWLAVSQWPGPNFFETIRMSYIHSGVGVIIEPFGRSRFSPYVGGQAQFAFPTALEYSLIVFDPFLSSPTDQIQIEGGQEFSVGWEISTGVRTQLSRRWSAALGFYFSYMDFQVNWPPQQYRNFPDGLMRLDKGGIELKCMYRL